MCYIKLGFRVREKDDRESSIAMLILLIFMALFDLLQMNALLSNIKYRSIYIFCFIFLNLLLNTIKSDRATK